MKALMIIGLFISQLGFAQALTYFKCVGSSGASQDDAQINVDILENGPINSGRGFAQVMVTPNRPTAARLAGPSGYYLLKSHIGDEGLGSTQYRSMNGSFADNTFQLEILDIQPQDILPPGRATVTLSSGKQFQVRCNYRPAR